MIDRFLAGLLGFARARTRWLGGFAALGLLLSCYALTVPLDFSFSGVMDRKHPEVARYFAASEAYGLGGVLLLLIEGPEEDLDRAVADVREALRTLPEIRSLEDPLSREVVMSWAPWLVPRDVFDAWVATVRAVRTGQAEEAPEKGGSIAWPLLPEVVRAGFSVTDAALAALEAQLAPTPPSGARLVRIVMVRDTFEMALDAEDFPTIRRVVDQALAPSRGGEAQVTARFAGMPAIVTQEQEATIARMTLLAPLSLALVLTILLTVERRLWMLASVALPMGLALGSTLAVVGLIAGRLTIMESLFGVMIFGLGIDFAVHLLMRVHEERARGLNFEASLQRAFLGTGRGVLAGGLTTAGAFFILAFAPDPVFYRLGLSGGLGLSLCLLFLLVLLPAEWAWIEERSGAADRTPTAWGPSALGRVASRCARRPASALLIGGLVLLMAGVEARSLTYETNLERVFSRDISAVETARRIGDLFGVHPGVWLVAAESVEEARAVTQAFEVDPLFSRSESAAALIPADGELRWSILDRLVAELASQQAAESGDLGSGDRTGPTGSPNPLSLLLAAHRNGPPSVATLPASLRERLVGPHGELLVLAYTEAATLDSAMAASERRAAQAIHPEATSMNAIYEALIGTDRPWLLPILIAVAAFIAVVLRLALGTFRHAFLAAVPAIFSLVVTIGLFASLGISPNTVTLVAFPLLLGLSVDDGIHVVQRMIEHPESPIGNVVDSVARSIALTTATTCGSVALLLFSRHPGIESVALVLLLGLPIALLATVTLMPALGVVLGLSRRP